MTKTFSGLVLAALLAGGCAIGAVGTGDAGGPGGHATGQAGSSGAAGRPGSAGGGGPAGASGAAGKPAPGAAGAGGKPGTAGASGTPDAGMPKDADPVYDAPPLIPAGRGATVPWIEYEAETATTRGQVIGPSRDFGTVAAEASGRRAVQLNAVGDFVELVATQRANAIVVRYVIPDSPGGGGTTATLDLYVGDALRQPLTLTSKYAWSYGGEESTANEPGRGGPHHYFDETRALVGDIPAGTKVKLQKDAANSASYYVVDLIDLEYVAPPLAQPANSLSLTGDCGAVPNDGGDDLGALRTCIGNAKGQGKSVFIPAGTYELSSGLQDVQGLSAGDVTIRGAGMWHSTLHGAWARFHVTGNNAKFYDFAIFGESTFRDDTASDNAFNGLAGSGARLENIWIEHTKVGYWVGAGGNVTNGLVITGCRIRDVMADGVNLCNGTSNSEIANSHFRNTGDDAAVSWSPGATGANTNNVIHFNTVQVPWRANCFGVYGGRDNRIEDNLCFDVVTYPGVLIAQQFDSQPFSGTTTVQRNSIIRAGGHFFNQEQGAIKIFTQQGAINGLVVKDIVIDAPTFSGLQFQGPNPLQNATFDKIAITGAGSYGVFWQANASGGATYSNVTVSGSAKGGSFYEPGASFDVNKGAGNSGW